MNAFRAWMAGGPAGSTTAEERVALLPRRMFWVAFLVRVAFMTLAHKYRMRVYLDHFDFGWEMGRIARALAIGRGFADPFNGHSGPTAWTAPLYPLILGGVFKVFGVYTSASAWVILCINSLFSAAIAPAVYEIAWRCHGREARGMAIARWSGWLWALYPAAMQYAVHWVWEMSLSAALFAWIFVLALRIRGIGEAPARSGQRTGLWALYGVQWGLVALSNSALMAFLPFCSLWTIWPELPRRTLPAARNAALAAVCCAAVVSPWVVRNWFAFHAFVPMRANFGAELYQSVLPRNEGFPWGATLSLGENDAEFQRYKRMGEVAFSKDQQARAMAIVHRHPALFLAHAAKRVYFFWMGVPHPADTGLIVELTREISYSFLSLGGLLGLALALRRGVPGAWLFFWAFASVPLVYYFVTSGARFRHPLEPPMTMLIVYLFRSAENARTIETRRRGSLHSATLRSG